jgi:hypothetical protein
MLTETLAVPRSRALDALDVLASEFGLPGQRAAAESAGDGWRGFLGPGEGYGIAVDTAGSAYVTGIAFSSNFPVRGGPDLTFNGVFDAFVAKVNPAGTGLVYAGFIGGSAGERGFGIAVDSNGNAYVTGETESPDFPTRMGPDLTFNGGTSGFLDSFVAKISETDGTPTTPTSREQCMKGGWQRFKDAQGRPLFKNQGQCVKFVETGGKQQPRRRS